MAFKLVFDGQAATVKLRRNMTVNGKNVTGAVIEAADAAARDIKSEGDKSILAGGNFTQRWTNAFYVDVTRKATNVVIAWGFRRELWFATIHEFGGTIRAKTGGLLWIPLPWTGIKERASVWAASHGGLFRVDRLKGGNPLLLSIRDKKPKYVGVESVTLRQRWHIRDRVKFVMTNFEIYYKAALNKRRR